ncbi:MAG: Ldh family oxidoreductase [Granulosicoccaceae bacterium]
MTDSQALKLTDVTELARNALRGQGFSDDQAAAIANTITAAERDGCTSHGLFRVPFYVKALQNPNTDASATPVLNCPKPALVRVDAANGFCPLALELGLPELSKVAKRQGIAALAINNAYNIAALWPEVEQLAEQGLVAMAFTCANAFVAPAGGNKPLFGTNPMAFAWPREGRAPLVFDQASSVCARGEIQLHLRDGKPIPTGWAVDSEGQPTTDPAAALEGAQLTFGGYKGSSIALMVELLAGALVGDLFSYESTEQDKAGTGAPFGGEFVLAIDPSSFNTGYGHLAHAEQLFERLLEQEGTRLPGDRRHRMRAAQADIEIPLSLYQNLLDYAKGG